MRMHERKRILPLEGRSTCGQGIEHQAERIEIGPIVDRPVHAPALLG